MWDPLFHGLLVIQVWMFGGHAQRHTISRVSNGKISDIFSSISFTISLLDGDPAQKEPHRSCQIALPHLWLSSVKQKKMPPLLASLCRNQTIKQPPAASAYPHVQVRGETGKVAADTFGLG